MLRIPESQCGHACRLPARERYVTACPGAALTFVPEYTRRRCIAGPDENRLVIQHNQTGPARGKTTLTRLCGRERFRRQHTPNIAVLRMQERKPPVHRIAECKR